MIILFEAFGVTFYLQLIYDKYIQDINFTEAKKYRKIF